MWRHVRDRVKAMRQDKLGPGAPRECDRQHLVDPRTRPPSSSHEMRARGPRRHAMLGCLASASANGSTSSASTQIPRARKIRRPGRRVPSRPRDRTGKIGEPSPSCLSADRLLHRKTILHKNPRTCTKTALRSRVIANYFRARDEFEPGSRDELLDRLRCGAATILDLSSAQQNKGQCGFAGCGGTDLPVAAGPVAAAAIVAFLAASASS